MNRDEVKHSSRGTVTLGSVGTSEQSFGAHSNIAYHLCEYFMESSLTLLIDKSWQVKTWQ